MLMSKQFLFGLNAYVRQAALSLHRTPNNDLEALGAFYADNRIPLPHEVVQQLDRFLPGGDSEVKGSLNAAIGLLTGQLSVLNRTRLLELRQALDEYGRLLRNLHNSSEEERGRLRLRLSYADAYLWRKLSSRLEDEVSKVDHLNAAEFHPHRTLREIVGDRWPLIEPER
jgi:hypothetical protein